VRAGEPPAAHGRMPPNWKWTSLGIRLNSNTNPNQRVLPKPGD